MKSDICSAFGKTCIKNVQSKDMIGKGNNKISKEYLAECILSFANLTTELSQFVNPNSPMLDIGDQLAASKETAAIKQVVTSFEQKFLKYSSEIESNSKVTAHLLTYMQDLQDSMKQGHSQSIPTESPAGMLPNTVSPKTNPIPVCEPFVEHKDNGISDELKQLMKDFVVNKADEFNSTSTYCDTMCFGKFGYRYSDGSYQAKPMPALVENLLEQVRPHLSNPKASINSCLVRRFKDGSQYTPPHRDNDLVFDPESEMVSIFIGASRKMKFCNTDGKKVKEIILEDGSVLVTSRQAQNFWVHGIESSDDMEGCYSFTFQHVAPYFINSTALIGGSNTRVMKFGEGKGTFGVWMPGKRVEAFHIEDIPDSLTIGPYRNFVIHTGVNNIKRRDRRSSCSLVNEMEKKCKKILEVYPRSKIYLRLLLPTKLDTLNYRIKELNSMLIELSHNYCNINIIDHPWSTLCDRTGCLKSELGKHDKNTGLLLDSDSLHLGKNGYRMFAKNIKEGIFGKRRATTRYSTHVQGRRLAATQGQNRDHSCDHLPPR